MPELDFRLASGSLVKPVVPRGGNGRTALGINPRPHDVDVLTDVLAVHDHDTGLIVEPKLRF
jgi:hypothetical protein